VRPRVLPSGERAFLLEFDDLDEVLAHYAALVSRPHPDVTDVVPAARTILVRVRDRDRLADVRDAVLASPSCDRGPGVGQEVVLSVTYDGPDLTDVANLLGMSAEALVRRHTGESWTVAFCGFAPGFAYLAGARSDWPVPRRADPRPRVPSGAVGLAGGFSGVYPRASPGGWQLLGRTDADLFDLDRDPPALLRPGTPVRFRDAGGGRS
jgi:KipI family sensor histidine kinase inhibitor